MEDRHRVGMSICLNILTITDVLPRDQELRFTVHESPDYYSLKVSVFNDDKKTDLIGETWVGLEEVIMHGGGQSDVWHNLHCKGKYAGEIRIELTYYDSRPKMENPSTKEENVDLQSQRQLCGKSERKNVDATRRRPLPAGPSNMAKKSVSQPAVQSLIQTRDFEDDRHQNSRPLSGTVVEDPRSNYHHSWSYDLSQDSIYYDRNPEFMRDRNVEQIGPNALNTDNSYLVGQHLSQEKSYDSYRSEAPIMNDAHYTSGYSKFNPHRLNEQAPNLSAMRSRTEPVPTLHANVQQYNRSILQPEHSMIPEGYVSEVGRSPYLARQDATGSSDISTCMGEYSTLSDSTRVGLQEAASVYPVATTYELSNVDVYGQQDDDQNLGNSYGDRRNSNSARISDPFHRQNNLIQTEADHSLSNREMGFGAQDEIPPPPPLHRIALNSSENGASRHSENTVLAPVPLRHVRQEVSHRHSYPNHHANSYEHATSGTSQDEVLQHSSLHRIPAAAYPDYGSRQDLRSSAYQTSTPQETRFRSSQTKFGNESTIEQDYSPQLNTEATQQNIGKRPLSLSIGRYQYEEDMFNSRNNQSVIMQTENMGPRKSLTHSDLANPSYTAYGNRASFSSQPRNSRETTPLTQPQVANPGTRHPRSSNHSTPTRKSVSPQPSRSTATNNHTSPNVPFSPDSYENMHPGQPAVSVSPVTHREPQPHPGSQGFIDTTPANGATAGKSIAATNSPDQSQDEPIIGPDGRIIDPSDHLPVDSWAPEPERKNPYKPAPIRVRVSPRGAQPMPSGAKRENATRITAYSASPLSSVSQGDASNDRTSDPRTRARLQKRPPGGKAVAGTRYENLVGTTEAPGASMSGGGAASQLYEGSDAAVPPVPAKIPFNAGVGVGVGGEGFGNDDLMALSEEMKSIDIGMGAGRNTGRMRRGRFG